MRTPVVLVAGQGDTDAVAGTFLRRAGTVVVEHRFDGHVVRRTTAMLCKGEFTTAEDALELAHGCVSCTVRNDLLALLRTLSRHAGVERIVVHLSEWLEPEPICVAINHVRVRIGPDYPDGPAALDVAIAGVVTCIDSRTWLTRALGDAVLGDGRTMAQAVVCQAEFADVLVLTRPEPVTLAVLRRLAPRARLTVGIERLETALANLEEGARRGLSDHPHGWLLAGRPPLGADGAVQIVEFNARRPFHPERLHAAVDLLLTGVVRARGRLWLASRPDQVMWLESAGAGMRVACAGKWLAAMTAQEVADIDAERRLFAELQWEFRFGDRHTAMTVLTCGAQAPDILDALYGALLTDAEMAQPRKWGGYPDPFGDWHEDPCDETAGTAEEVASDADRRES
ncbi:hypothetical protein AWC05_21950 [Mycobacterium florentinum]|uniref:CobW C-terminal domain-containing protein n=1 Tax=Mycobacterium florentinum TaxID=292462 RepID=A0A1X1U5Q5_MYCFL|nr:GTP-binding protein [Mycobacterium florentinum]MCV7410197.1 GTP-binding protein [Mycobacterium florentinum]ORV52194.1 hypothetical protein AWC05_21950 [Mycobacterium florentinum]BBX79507.1 hypothetical protein MFLOJ_32940 [Mycobacterium florentinum]